MNEKANVGKSCDLYCQVGVVLNLGGKLRKGTGFTFWDLELPDGQRVGFSFGQFTADAREVRVSIA